MKINIHKETILADLLTPVVGYLRLRQHFHNAALLESNDFKAVENSRSILGVQPIIQVEVKNYKFKITKEEQSKTIQIDELNNVPDLLYEELQKIQVLSGNAKVNGFIGHTGFEAVKYFDTLDFVQRNSSRDIPDMNYYFYRFLVVFDHYHDELTIIENCPDGSESEIEKFKTILLEESMALGAFKMVDDELSNSTEEEFLNMVEKGQRHCKRGDVFQIVLSRGFSLGFEGDDFQVYRKLRSINPSPYLYYFDFGNYKIFGSSPEQQLVIEDGVAKVNPIAGTYKRTGNDIEDAKKAKELSEDPKEVAEHIMLVDLARNDLGRHTKEVTVKNLKEIHFYSHVIHLVSNVEGKLDRKSNPIRVFADTFPAGTLSGAPKFRAMELINAYEPEDRKFYGGGIGIFGLNGDINHAIVIRSFMSYENRLYLQAGAGIVNKSIPESELQEVNNKLGALRKALDYFKNQQL